MPCINAKVNFQGDSPQWAQTCNEFLIQTAHQRYQRLCVYKDISKAVCVYKDWQITGLLLSQEQSSSSWKSLHMHVTQLRDAATDQQSLCLVGSCCIRDCKQNGLFSCPLYHSKWQSNGQYSASRRCYCHSHKGNKQPLILSHLVISRWIARVMPDTIKQTLTKPAWKQSTTCKLSWDSWRDELLRHV